MRNLYSNIPIIEQHVDRLLGTEIHALLTNAVAQEISVNPDGRIWMDDGNSLDMLRVEGYVEPGAIETTLRLIAAVTGVWINLEAPFVNTTLACGARISGALPPVSKDGPQLSIRTHVRILRPLTAFMTEEQAEWLKDMIRARKNIIVAGGTNTGKTTLVNSMVNEIPDGERLVIIEDAAELQIDKPNIIRRLATEKADMKRHVRETLRQRPDRIIVSEVRGAEAWDMLDAMRTGHSGCMSTVHANSAAQALTRLAGLAGCDLQMVREAIQLVLFLERGKDGRRYLAGSEQLEV